MGRWGYQAVGSRVGAGLACVALTFCACASKEPADGLDRSLYVVDVAPRPDDGLLPVNPRIDIVFNRYLDTEELTYFNAISLESGGVRAWDRAVYRLTGKRATLIVRSELQGSLYYDMSFNPEVLRSVEGYPFVGPDSIRFEVGDGLAEYPAPQVPEWSDVAPLFAACDECHGDEEWSLPRVDREGMVGVWSQQAPSLLLVRPGDASQSYLMHKILPDYPLRDGTVQPPPWAGLSALSEGELDLVERWIQGGAQ